MKITKIGHCCLLIEDKGIRIITDPGSFSTAQNEEKNIDAVIITHEHGDHFHVESLKNIIANNPKVRVISNIAVSHILEKELIICEVVCHGEKTEVNGITIEGHGDVHAEIYKTITPVENTGYMIRERLFYPGDAFYDPGIPVDILALPVAGPWMKISDAIEYAKEVNPKVTFPVHDGMYKDPVRFQYISARIFSEIGINFITMSDGEAKEF